MNQKFSTKARQKARRFAMQALYQWHFNHSSLEALEKDFLENEEVSADKIDALYFSDVVRGALQHSTDIDAILETCCSRALNELTPVELAVLRLAVYELKYRLDIPGRVVINEALELNKSFGTQEGYKFVNGVLDKLAKQLRPVEF